MKQPALVLDGNTKQALAIVRSLGMAGVPVYVGAERGTAMALHSRYRKGKFTYPSPKDDQRGFIDVLKEYVREIEGVPVVYGCSDATVCTLMAFRYELGDSFELGLPDGDSFDIAFDKAATYSEARVHGVPAIKTFLRERYVEVNQLGKEITFPAVMKPRQSVIWKDDIGVSGTASFVHTPKEMLEHFQEQVKETGMPPLIQPFIQGEEYGVEVLAKEGAIVAAANHHRIRSLSPTGGASVVKETMEEGELSDKLYGYAAKLVSVLQWSGPMMLEFKVDNDTREPLLVEINGRWWGSLPLAIAAGVDFPLLNYTMVTEGVVPDEVVRSHSGVTTRYFLGDVWHLLRVLFARDPMRSELYPTRRKALKDFFRSFRGTKGDVWNWRDPLPAFMEYIDVIAKIWK